MIGAHHDSVVTRPMHAGDGLLVLAVGAVALLYASVGHAGATGYIAVMTLWGLTPAVIRPTALVLNVVVGAIASLQFWRAGHLERRLLVPLCAASVPCAAWGGALGLSTSLFELVVGIVLLVSAARILRDASGPRREPRGPVALARTSPAWLAGLGGGLGFLSGLTGVGGGVFLTPALLALDAAPVRQVAAVSAAFILVNSIAGLVGAVVSGRTIPPVPVALLAAVILGGAAGAHLGAFRLPSAWLRRLMAVVLVVAGLNLLGRAAR